MRRVPFVQGLFVSTLIALAGAACSSSSRHVARATVATTTTIARQSTSTAAPRHHPRASIRARPVVRLTHDRTVYAFGSASFLGSARTLAAPLVGMAQTPNGNGYWLVANDGGVFGFRAPFYGSLARSATTRTIVGMAAARPGGGYWLVGSDGGVFSFGDARFFGSAADLRLAAPVQALVGAPRGDGYWLLGRDGGVFAFGAAHFYGRARSHSPIVDMVATPSGHGYWLVGSDGGVFSFGDARFFGSAASLHLRSPIVGIDRNREGTGYWLAADDGGVFTFGASRYLGNATALIAPGRAVEQIAAMPDGRGYRLLALPIMVAPPPPAFVAAASAASVRSRSAPEPSAPPSSGPSPAAPAPSPPPPSAPPSPPPSGGVYAIGDSVMIDAAPSLQAVIPGIVVNASVSRQASSGVALLSQLAASGQLPGTVVWHLGTNGSFSAAQLDQVLRIASGRRVIMLTDHCGYCSWTPGNNATIAAGCTEARRCTVADWNALANANPGWFGGDTVHMAIGGAGARAYAQLVASKL